MFDDRSMVRRVNGESALLLAGGRALLMQLAHPLVAAGVAEHSSFEGDRMGRLLRTLRPTYAILFGDEVQARAAGAGIQRVHEYVTGPGYSANDPALLVWVHATLVDSGLDAYRRFVRPLSRTEMECYYIEARRIAELVGLPTSFLPPDLEAFDAYVADVIATLEVGDLSRELARTVFESRPLFAAPALSGACWLTAGLLPRRLREAYGLRWSPLDERALRVLEAASRAVLPRLPRAWRRPPWPLMPPSPGTRGSMRAGIAGVIISRER